MVEDHLEPDLAGIGHDRVHDLQTTPPLQVGVLAEVDAVGLAAGVEELVAVRQADRVEAERLHLIHHLPVASGPEAVWGEVRRLEAEQVHTGDPHRLVVGVEDLAAGGAEVAGGHAGLRVAFGDRDIADRDAREGRWSGRAGEHRIAPVVAPGEAEATDGHRRNSRVEVRQLPRRPRVVAVERPHREHSQALGPGERFQAIGVLQGEHLREHVVDAQHRRHPQLIPPEALALAGEQRRHLREGGVGGVDGILAHRLELRRSGAVAVIHRHHVDAVDLHAGDEGDLHGVHAILREPLGQHREREPHAQARTALLHQRDGVHLELERLGLGERRPFDVEVDLVQLQRVHHLAVGRRQGLGPQPALGVRLRQAHARRPAQRHHHVAPGGSQGVDFSTDRDRLLVARVECQDVVPCPGQLSAGTGLHEAQGEKPHAVSLRQTVEIRHGILPHVDVGGEKLFLPEVATRGCCRSGRRSGRRHRAVIMATGHGRADRRLVAVGDLAGRSGRRQQRCPADEREVLGGVAERHLQLILHDLVVMKLDIPGDELGLRHAHEQDALVGGQDGNRQAFGRVRHREPLAGAEVEETELHRGRIEAFDPLADSILVRPHVDRAAFPRADALLPGDHAADVLTQMLVHHDTEVGHREVAVADTAQHLELGCRCPRIDDRHLAGLGLGDDQVVDRHVREVEAVAGGIESHDVVGGRVGEEHTSRRAVGRGRRGRRSGCGRRRRRRRRRGRSAAHERQVAEHCRTPAGGGGEAEGRRTPGREQAVPAFIADGVVAARAAGDHAVPQRRDLSVEVKLDRPGGIRGVRRVANRHVAVETAAPVARD